MFSTKHLYEVLSGLVIFYSNRCLCVFFRCACIQNCIKSKIGQKWRQIREFVLGIVDTSSFEWFILVLIFASSVTLCFEDIHLDENQDLKRVLYWTNLVFSIIFILEMLLKWVALGFYKYFTSFWTLLDFLIVFVRTILKWSLQLLPLFIDFVYRSLYSVC